MEADTAAFLGFLGCISFSSSFYDFTKNCVANKQMQKPYTVHCVPLKYSKVNKLKIKSHKAWGYLLQPSVQIQPT